VASKVSNVTRWDLFAWSLPMKLSLVSDESNPRSHVLFKIHFKIILPCTSVPHTKLFLWVCFLISSSYLLVLGALEGK
jgi:hypothetical protein